MNLPEADRSKRREIFLGWIFGYFLSMQKVTEKLNEHM